MGRMAETTMEGFEAWLAETLLEKNQTIIDKRILDQIIDQVQYLHERAKYYGEVYNTVELLEELHGELKTLKRGGRH